MAVPLLFATFVAMTAIVPPHPPACLRYAPDTVGITGRLVQRTFFGPPNFGEDPTHDTRERGYYLRLPTPVCTVAGGLADAASPVRNVRLIQLVLDSAGYARLRPRLGRSVMLRGTLSASETGHHHAPLLLSVIPAGLSPRSR